MTCSILNERGDLMRCVVDPRGPRPLFVSVTASQHFLGKRYVDVSVYTQMEQAFTKPQGRVPVARQSGHRPWHLE